jgi:GNAT superfamily N-acetyltransferase
VKVREAVENDAAAIAVVVHAMNELRSVASQPVETTANTIGLNLKRMVSSGSSTSYVAENSDATVVGYCAVHWVPFLFFAGGEAYVTELFVLPSNAGRGIGSALLETAVEEARRRGCSRVSLLNGRDSQAYRREFYKKRGWIEREGMANFILPLKKETNKSPEPPPASVPHS